MRAGVGRSLFSTTVAPTDIYEALQHGTLDYSFINPGNSVAFKLVEVGKNSCGPVMAITGHNVTISKRTWGRLPKNIQQAFMEQTPVINVMNLPFVNAHTATTCGTAIDALGSDHLEDTWLASPAANK